MAEIATIERNGQQFIFDYSKNTKAEVEYLDDDARLPKRQYAVCYRYRLLGAHEGPPIEVLVVNPRPECDEEGCWGMEWEDVLFADDLTPADADGHIEDAYWEAIREDLRAMDWSD